MAVFSLVAEAESHVHGVPVPEIHFHEVGTMDAVADIAAVSMLMDRLQPDEVVVSPIHVGFGHVRCAHGILPVPAPATAYILSGIPYSAGNVEGELCTPTGAALLRHFASRFAQMPMMKVNGIGYGMGTRDFGTANCVRAMIGESEGKEDSVIMLSCNIDDMTGEALGFAMDMLFAEGALDVWKCAIGMKKSRPGIMLSVLCLKDDQERLARTVFRHTSTLGIRIAECSRAVLDRSSSEVETPYGRIRMKTSSGYGVIRRKAEYDDLERIAREKGITLEELSGELRG